MMFQVLVYVAIVMAVVDGFAVRARLPAYFELCSRNDPKLNECFVRSGNKAIPHLVKGDARYNIPSMLPYKLKEAVIRNDQNIRFVLKNLKVYGLQNAKLKGVNVNFEQSSLSQNITIPQLSILGDYELNGNIAEEYIEGKGKANMTLVNGLYSTKMYFRTINNHAVPYGSYSKYKPQIVFYDFENLYNGNSFRGYQTNVHLNNNWKAVNKEFERGISRYINEFITDIYKTVTDIAPANELYLP